MKFEVNDDIIAEMLSIDTDFRRINIIKWSIDHNIIKENDSHCSEASRLTVEYKKDNKLCKEFLFFKIPYSCANYERLRPLGVYEKEIRMYTKIFPEMYKLLNDQYFAPKYFYTDNKHALILKDITQSGYRMPDRMQQLDFEHCACCFRTLARFHGLSYKLNQNCPDLLQNIKGEPVWQTLLKDEEFKFICQSRFDIIANRFIQLKGEQLSNFKNNFWSAAAKDIQPSTFNVLNHGDLWTNNLMYQYDKCGNVKNVKLIDFQMCQWASPAIDIIYFTVTSIKFEVYEKYYDLLLGIYLNTLNRTLKYLHCDFVYKLNDLKNEIKNKYNFLIFILVSIVPVVLSEGNHNSAANKYGVELVNGEKYSEVCGKWLSHLTQKNIFSNKESSYQTQINEFLHYFQNKFSVAVKNHEIESNFIKSGSNFCSGIIRLTIDYQIGDEMHRKSVLFKIPSLGPTYEQLKNFNIYSKETLMYNEILPEMYELWKDEIFTPICYPSSDPEILILEDLNESGYCVKDKIKQLDLEHCEIVLKTLARFHALSVKYIQVKNITNETMKKYRPTFIYFDNYVKSAYEIFLNTVSRIDLHSTVEKLKNLQDAVSETVKLTLSPSDGFNVLLQGDFWINNMLFKYDEEHRVQKLKIIDLQLSRFGSPVIDIIYFFVTSAKYETFEENRDKLIKLYLNTLNETLSQLECNSRYTENDIEKDLLKFKFQYIQVVSMALPIVLSDTSNIMGNSKENDEEFIPSKSLYTSSLYETGLLKWLKFIKNEII